MLRRYLILLLIPFLLIDDAEGEVVEIPLPELLGIYSGQVLRFVDFQIQPIPLVIHSVQFRTSGFYEAGQWQCIDGTVMCWPIIVDSKIMDPDAGWWFWYFMGPCVDGEMTVTSDYVGSSVNPPSWDFLLDGEGRLSFMVGPDYTLGDCHPITDMITAEIYEAVLVINMEPLVATDALTWGRLKALYR